jgi:glutaconate CoA-transferase subunit B
VTLMSHERRRLVDRVSFVTSPGYGDGSPGWRKRNGLLGAGPSAIVTTMCVFRFPEGGGAAYLDSIHPGHSLDEVRANTGWDVGAGEDVKVTAAPTAPELAVIRNIRP